MMGKLINQNLYPNEKWIHGRFKNAPRNTWRDKGHTREYLEYLKTVLSIEKEEDWYIVSMKQVCNSKPASHTH